MLEVLTAFSYISPVLNYAAGAFSKAKKKKWRVAGVVCAVVLLVLSSICTYQKDLQAAHSSTKIQDDISEMKKLLSLQLENDREKGNLAPESVTASGAVPAGDLPAVCESEKPEMNKL
jgi:hypothetical protein